MEKYIGGVKDKRSIAYQCVPLDHSCNFALHSMLPIVCVEVLVSVYIWSRTMLN